MVSKKTVEPIFIEKRVGPFNCPSCSSIKETVKTYGNGKQVLECGDYLIYKEKHLQKQLVRSKMDFWEDIKPCPECNSKKRYSVIESGNEVKRCAKCDALI